MVVYVCEHISWRVGAIRLSCYFVIWYALQSHTAGIIPKKSFLFRGRKLYILKKRISVPLFLLRFYQSREIPDFLIPGYTIFHINCAWRKQGFLLNTKPFIKGKRLRQSYCWGGKGGSAMRDPPVFVSWKISGRTLWWIKNQAKYGICYIR